MTVTSDPGFQGAAPLPRLPWRSYLLAIVALLGSLLLVLLYWRSAEQRARQAAEAAFGDQAEAMETALQQRLHTYELIARGGVSLFATVERPTAAQWRDYVQALDIPNRYADMMGLGYAPALGQSGLQQLQLAQREAGEAEAVVQAQLDSVLAVVGAALADDIVVAYEPVWAIGTGRTATPDQAEIMHAFIRSHLERSGVAAQKVKILYGGSVTASNASLLFVKPNIDGALVGGASLVAESFSLICAAAAAI